MTMDLAPTFAPLAEIEFPKEKTDAFDGKDLSPVLFENQDLEKRVLFWRFINPYVNSHAYAVRDGTWKYMMVDGKRFFISFGTRQNRES